MRVGNQRMWALTGLAVFCCGISVEAGDWPQILGPQRNGIAIGEPALAPWPPAGPRKLWSAELGAGYAGPVIVGNRAIAFHRVGMQERIECFDVVTGKSQWQANFRATYNGGVNPDQGPRCVPLVDHDRVYVFGAAGELHCVALADGKEIWSRDAYAEYRGQTGYFGAGSTPIVVAGKLIVNVGGRNAGIVAFDAANGKEVWAGVDERASYSSPTTATIQGRQYAIFITRMKCVAVEPNRGDVLFSLPFGKSGPTVNAATPLVIGENLFLSASYDVGAAWLRLAQTPVEIWADDKTMSSQYTTCLYHAGHLYGIHGREDFGNGELRCIEATTGKVCWQVPGFGVGHLILVGDQLLILTTEGKLVLAAAKPDQYTELSRSSVSTNITRSLPAFANGRFCFRDNPDSGGRLTCLTFK